MAATVVNFPTPSAVGNTGASRPVWDQQLARVVSVLQRMTHEQLVLSEVFAKAIVRSDQEVR